jgi:hypothetical protein
MKPPLTGNWRGTIASITVVVQYVMLTLARSRQRPSSAPSSFSVATSALRLLLPRFDGRMPGPSADGWGEYVVNFANELGCRPDLPSAARTRIVEMRSLSLRSASDGRTDALFFG